MLYQIKFLEAYSRILYVQTEEDAWKIIHHRELKKGLASHGNLDLTWTRLCKCVFLGEVNDKSANWQNASIDTITSMPSGEEFSRVPTLEELQALARQMFPELENEVIKDMVI